MTTPTRPLILLSDSTSKEGSSFPFPEKEGALSDEAMDEVLPGLSAEDRLAIRRRDAVKESRISPPGTLKFPHGPNELLEKKRHLYGLVDNLLTKEVATFNNVYVYQLPFREVLAPGSSIIQMPDITQERYNRDGPRGIIVSAGAGALEVLRSNGIDIGHTVTFQRHAPWKVTLDTLLGQEECLLSIKVGDIVGCEELCQELTEGRTRYVHLDDGQVQVVTLDKRYEPITPRE